jgi:hypothetical protein
MQEATTIFENVAFGLLGLVLLVVFLVVWIKIMSRTGYNGALGCLMLVPVVNLILMLVLAFKEWPVERENKRLKEQLRQP